MPTARGSSSSAELLAGFRVERSLGASTWEAVQPELGRRVALHRLPPGAAFDASRWPERAGVPRLYAVAETAHGTYVATQLVAGARALSECARARAGRRRRWVDEAAAVVDGAPHGRLTARDILVDPDGGVWVTRFGQAWVQDDAAALAGIREAQRNRPAVAAALAAVLAAGGVTAALALSAGDEPAPRAAAPAPEVADEATAVGSALAPGALRTVDCEGRPPSGSSNTCTVMQLSLGDRPLEAPFEGLVRSWAVRGASGRIALQILVPRGDGYARFNGTRVVTVDEPDGTQVFRSDRLAPKGARFGLEIEPGGAVGIRPGVAGARTGRVFGLLRHPAETPDLRGGAGEELLLRVDLEPRRG